MSGDIVITCTAMSKMVLHASRHPHLAVSGVVLASTHNSESNSDIIIADAIPLFHLQLTLAPMLEVALTQIEQVYQTKGLTIAGYYQANEHLRDNVPDFVALKVSEKIAENNSNACLIMIDNQKVSMHLESIPLTVSQLNSDGKWKNKEKACVRVDSSTLDITSHLLQRGIQAEIYDFDNHLDDLSCDWTNPHVNKLVDAILASAASQG